MFSTNVLGRDNIVNTEAFAKQIPSEYLNKSAYLSFLKILCIK